MLKTAIFQSWSSSDVTTNAQEIFEEYLTSYLRKI